MGEVSLVEIAPLVWRWVVGGIEEVRRWPMVIRGPFVEVVRDVESEWVGRSVFEVDNNDLENHDVICQFSYNHVKSGSKS